jgi:hypothetical protein
MKRSAAQLQENGRPLFCQVSRVGGSDLNGPWRMLFRCYISRRSLCWWWRNVLKLEDLPQPHKEIIKHMMDNDFFDFCVDLYRHERDEADRLYMKLPLGISANVVIGGAVVFITSGKYIDNLFNQVEVLFYYSAAALSAIALTISSVLLAFSLVPRKYALMNEPTTWFRWRKEAEQRIRDTDYEYSDEQIRDYVTQYTKEALMQELAETTRVNRIINKRRTRYFVYAMWLTVASLAPLILQGVLDIILWCGSRPSGPAS